MPNYRCRFCHKSFAWESAQYPFIWSRVLVHLGECESANFLSRDQRSIEARNAADGIVGPRREPPRGVRGPVSPTARRK